MKLIDLLVRELPNRGGWPTGAIQCVQSAVDKELYFQGDCKWSSGIHLEVTAEDEAAAQVSKEQYEAALAASKQTAWIPGELPPIGAYAEVIDTNSSLNYGHGESGEVVAHVENTAVIRMSYGLGCFTAKHLRPSKSEAQRKREEAGVAIYHAINWNAEGELASPSRMEDYRKAYDAIAAGEIPGVKLAD